MFHISHLTEKKKKQWRSNEIIKWEEAIRKRRSVSLFDLTRLFWQKTRVLYNPIMGYLYALTRKKFLSNHLSTVPSLSWPRAQWERHWAVGKIFPVLSYSKCQGSWGEDKERNGRVGWAATWNQWRKAWVLLMTSPGDTTKAEMTVTKNHNYVNQMAWLPCVCSQPERSIKNGLKHSPLLLFCFFFFLNPFPPCISLPLLPPWQLPQ